MIFRDIKIIIIPAVHSATIITLEASALILYNNITIVG